MLKEYQITNFKAFSEPVNIPIKPITLIFGANSSGKSSILQSLLMLKQTLDKAKSSEQPLVSEGELVKLGGYPEFIHRHDIGRSFSFKVTMQRPGDISSAFPVEDYLDSIKGISHNFEKLNESGDFDTIGMSITFSYDQGSGATTTSEINLFLGDDPAPIFTYKNELPHKKTLFRNDDKFDEYALRVYKKSPSSFLKLTHINYQHRYWKSYHSIFGKEELDSEKKPEDFLDFQNIRSLVESREENQGRKLDRKPDQKKINEEILDALALFPFEGDFLLLRNYLPELLNGRDAQYIIYEDFDSENSNNVSLFTLSASYLFRHFLESIIYLSPLRPYPNPDILIKDQEFMERLNDINKQFCSFNMGYELKVVPFSSQASDIHDDLKLKLFDKSKGVHLSFTDIGVGVGQVFPVIVDSMISKGKTILIEQPELHLHPALQSELGDLFINSALSDQKNMFFIETHSEHLILRLLRRIRETTDGELPNEMIPITPEDLCVLYVQPGKNGSDIIHLPITQDGEFERPWPDGFFAERSKELF